MGFLNWIQDNLKTYSSPLFSSVLTPKDRLNPYKSHIKPIKLPKNSQKTQEHTLKFRLTKWIDRKDFEQKDMV
jgi:hypothetical protein